MYTQTHTHTHIHTQSQADTQAHTLPYPAVSIIQQDRSLYNLHSDIIWLILEHLLRRQSIESQGNSAEVRCVSEVVCVCMCDL